MRTALVSTICALALASGCSSVPTAGGQPWEGTVQSIQETESTGGWQGTAGSVSGSILGALLGSGIGSGVGTTIATVITSSMGAVGGQKVGQVLGAKTAYAVTIRDQNGIDRRVMMPGAPTFRPGAAVRVGADGSVTAR